MVEPSNHQHAFKSVVRGATEEPGSTQRAAAVAAAGW